MFYNIEHGSKTWLFNMIIFCLLIANSIPCLPGKRQATTQAYAVSMDEFLGMLFLSPPCASCRFWKVPPAYSRILVRSLEVKHSNSQPAGIMGRDMMRENHTLMMQQQYVKDISSCLNHLSLHSISVYIYIYLSIQKGSLAEQRFRILCRTAFIST